MNSFALHPTSESDYGVTACANDNSFFFACSATANAVEQHHPPKYNSLKYTDIYMGRMNSMNLNPEWGNPEKLIVTTQQKGYVVVYDFPSFSIKEIHSKHKVACRSQLIDAIFFGNDVVVSITESGFIISWNIRTGVTTETQLEVHDRVTCVSACPHKQGIVAFGCKTGAIEIFDLKIMGVVHRLMKHTSAIMDFAWCPTEFNVFDVETEVPDDVSVSEIKSDVKSEISREYLLASSALEDSKIIIWRAYPENRDADREVIQTELQSDATKTKISLSWVAPFTLLSSNKTDLLEWNFTTKSSNGLYQSRLVHKKHTCNILSIEAPIKLFKSFSPTTWRETPLPCSWTISEDGRRINSTISPFEILRKTKPHSAESEMRLSISKIIPALLEISTNKEALRLLELGNPKSLPIDTFKIITHLFTYALPSTIKKHNISALTWHPERKNRLTFGTSDGQMCDIYMYFDTFEHFQPGNVYNKYSNSQIDALEWGPVPFSEKVKDFGMYAVADDQLLMFEAVKPFFGDQKDAKVLLDSTSKVTQVKWKPDFKVCAVGNQLGEILFYNKNFEFLTKVHTTFSLPIRALAWHPRATGKDLEASPSNHWLAASTQFEIAVFDLEDLNLEEGSQDSEKQPKVVAKFSCNLVEWRNIKSIEWNPRKSANLVAVTDDACITVWNVANDEVVALIEGKPSSEFSCVSWSPHDEDEVISGGDSNMLSWKISAHVLPQHEKKIISQLQGRSYDQQIVDSNSEHLKATDQDEYVAQRMREYVRSTKVAVSLREVEEKVALQLENEKKIQKIQAEKEAEKKCKAQEEPGTEIGDKVAVDSQKEEGIEEVTEDETVILTGTKVEEKCKAQEEPGTEIGDKVAIDSQKEEEIEEVTEDETVILTGTKVEEKYKAQEEPGTEIGDKVAIDSQKEEGIEEVTEDETVILTGTKVEEKCKAQEEPGTEIGVKGAIDSQKEEGIEEVTEDETVILTGTKVEEKCKAQEEPGTEIGDKVAVDSQKEEGIEEVTEDETVILTGTKVEEKCKAQEEPGTEIGDKVAIDSQKEEKIEEVTEDETVILTGTKVEEKCKAQEEPGTEIGDKVAIDSQKEEEIEEVTEDETVILTGTKVEEKCKAQEEPGTEIGDKVAIDSQKEEEIEEVTEDETVILTGTKVEEKCKAQEEPGTEIGDKVAIDSQKEEEIEEVTEDETVILTGTKVEEKCKAQEEPGTEIGDKVAIDSQKEEKIEEVTEDETVILTGTKVEEKCKAQEEPGTEIWDKVAIDSQKEEGIEEVTEDETVILTGTKVEEKCKAQEEPGTEIGDKVAIDSQKEEEIEEVTEDETVILTGTKVEEKCKAQEEPGTEIGDKVAIDSQKEEGIEEVTEDETVILTGTKVEEKCKAQEEPGTEIGDKVAIDSQKEEGIEEVTEDETVILTGTKVEEKCNAQEEPGTKIGNIEGKDSHKKGEVKPVIAERVVIEDVEENKTEIPTEVEMKSITGNKTDSEETKTDSDGSSDNSFDIISDDQCADAVNIDVTDTSIFDNKCILM